MLANGATTLWERWEYETGGAMNSHNHPMMGSVDSWFYKYILGILPDTGSPGFEKFTIHPFILTDLDFAEGEFDSVKGKIKSAWRKEKGSVYLTVTIPANSTVQFSVSTAGVYDWKSIIPYPTLNLTIDGAATDAWIAMSDFRYESLPYTFNVVNSTATAMSLTVNKR
jgi:hypothetical protein